MVIGWPEHYDTIPINTARYSTVSVVLPISLSLCLEWYNGSITPRVQAWPNQHSVGYTTDCWMSVINYCLECESSFNTHLSHSRQWFNIGPAHHVRQASWHVRLRIASLVHRAHSQNRQKSLIELINDSDRKLFRQISNHTHCLHPLLPQQNHVPTQQSLIEAEDTTTYCCT